MTTGQLVLGRWFVVPAGLLVFAGCASDAASARVVRQSAALPGEEAPDSYAEPFCGDPSGAGAFCASDAEAGYMYFDVKDSELKLAVNLVQQLATDEFKPEQYRDDVRDRVLELINNKIEGQDITAAPSEQPAAQIIDLMAALKASLGEPEEAKPAKRAARKPSAARKRGSQRKAG